jgi:zinc protease
MGFLKDIEDMPNQFEYSRRSSIGGIVLNTPSSSPENGRGRGNALVEKYWGDWKPGRTSPDSDEPGPKPCLRPRPVEHADTTLGAVGFHGRPSDTEKITRLGPAVDLYFGSTSAITSDWFSRNRVDSLFSFGCHG